MRKAMTVHASGVTHAKAVEASRESCSLLTINGGSSSIRFALYEAGEPLRRLLDGKDRSHRSERHEFDRQGFGRTIAGQPPPLTAADHRSAVAFLLDWLETQPVFASVKAVGHRVVHGMKHSEPERVTPKLLAELHRITPYDPDHLPREIELIEAFRQRHPTLPQVACFDTAFHRTMPRVAKSAADPATLRGEGRSSATASTACPMHT